MTDFILITRGIVIYPNTTKKIKLGREISISTVKKALEKNSQLIITSQINTKKTTLNSIDEIFTIGVLVKINDVDFSKKDDFFIVVEGLSRILIQDININKIDNEIKCNYLLINDSEFNKIKATKEIETLMSLIQKSDNQLSKNISIDILNNKIEDLSSLNIFYKIANDCLMTLEQKQSILSSNSIDPIYDILSKLFISQNDMSSIDKEINQKINQSLSKQQKEFYLREKLRIVKEELGELSSKENDANNLRKKLNNNPYPSHIKEKLIQEINKLETSNQQETSMIRNYIEWLLEIPWWQEGKDNNNINNVKNVLDISHYGLEKVKERIVEYLAVRARAKNSKAPIICLVGPPGVGKSSLAKSIAEALNKTFVKMALGGVKDESEIRGHRRTYLGAMPGRIIKSMKKAGVINPLFLLDEIDKMSSDMRGDPASALLEVLDPEQNDRFSDNYIEEDYNLSKVMFIATANYQDQIPEALYDRLEIIELTSYTELEKLAIAKKYLISKVYNQCNLTEKEISFNDDALLYMIRHYTREAGVRELERLIQKISRKFLVKISNNEKNTPKEIINLTSVKKYLDKEIFEYNVKEKYLIPGIVNGMAYTSAGGDLLQIEVTSFPGKGDIKITGNLKETMKESAEVAMAFVKTNAKKFNVDNVNFKDVDIHIHVPSGGIPKDGPSAGVTLTTAIISCLSNRAVKNTISMTGEITLRGKVLIIGGVKEKVISAKRAGINEIFLPEKDERFLKDIPDEIMKDLKIHLVSDYDEIYSEIFNKKN